MREAWAGYRTPVDYGLVKLDLPKVAALIAAGVPTRLYYVSYRNNAFDTHVHQVDLHQRLLGYVSDAVAGFLRDMERIGRADDVVLMVFSEFGRRVPENASLGTDHGTAGPMFLAGKPVRGGQYGEPPSLTASRPTTTWCTPPTSAASTPPSRKAGSACRTRRRCCAAASSRSRSSPEPSAARGARIGPSAAPAPPAGGRLPRAFVRGSAVRRNAAGASGAGGLRGLHHVDARDVLRHRPAHPAARVQHRVRPEAVSEEQRAAL